MPCIYAFEILYYKISEVVTHMPPGKFETERVRDFKMSVYLGKFQLFHPKTYFVPQKFRIAQQKINLVCKEKKQFGILFFNKNEILLCHFKRTRFSMI